MKACGKRNSTPDWLLVLPMRANALASKVIDSKEENGLFQIAQDKILSLHICRIQST